ncbi:hypothetical protein PWT90_08176 [Aphanocladium album]|nr:hypothetical protein PWT90_08176 [Aphanocladium album]
MGFGYKWILSFCMLIIPIAITLGVLFPIQNKHRQDGHSGSVLGDGGFGSPGGGGMPKNKDNNVDLETVCTQFADLGNPKRYFWEKGQQQYTFNPNQWGLTNNQKSGMCMNVSLDDPLACCHGICRRTTASHRVNLALHSSKANTADFQVAFNNNGSYSKPEKAPPFSVTWQYKPAPAEQNNVHAFANVKLEEIFPKKLDSIKKLFVDFEWTYVLGSENSTTSQAASLGAQQVNTNVAIDMFADKNRDTSKDNVEAAWEIMIWFAAIGPSAHVIGQDSTSIRKTMTLNDTTTNAPVTFDLWADKHPSTKQYVMTWKAQQVTEKFHGDVYPLVNYILTTADSNFPTSEAYLGSFGMGTEAYDAPSNVTFYCPDFAVSVE